MAMRHALALQFDTNLRFVSVRGWICLAIISLQSEAMAIQV